MSKNSCEKFTAKCDFCAYTNYRNAFIMIGKQKVIKDKKELRKFLIEKVSIGSGRVGVSTPSSTLPLFSNKSIDGSL